MATGHVSENALYTCVVTEAVISETKSMKLYQFKYFSWQTDECFDMGNET